MEGKKYKEKYSKKVSKKKVENKRKVDVRWILTITITAFTISIFFSFLSTSIISKVKLIPSIAILLIVIIIGVIFDMIGISVTVADIATFNSMASKRVRGASLAVKFIKNASKLSSFCNDVIGDICGIISGALASSIAISIASSLGANNLLITLIITGSVAALTIGGKACGKSFAINKCNFILFEFSKFLSFFIKK